MGGETGGWWVIKGVACEMQCDGVGVDGYNPKTGGI